jgi:putative tricarboxylic transport membrane protein
VQIDDLLSGFETVVEPKYLLLTFAGVLIGTFVGVLPGLGPTGAMSILFSVMFATGDPIGTMILFAGIFYGAMYGGSTTTILLNAPGETASAVTALDGYAMAKRGRAGAALATAAVGSFVACFCGTIGLMLAAEPLSRLALRFGPAEYFGLMVMSLMFVSVLGGKPSRSDFGCLFGIAVGTVGIDSGTGHPLLTGGRVELFDGIDLVIVAIGLFAVSEVLIQAGRIRGEVWDRGAAIIGSLYMTKEEWRRSAHAWLRGTGLGFVFGVLPGLGAAMSAFVAYAIERAKSRTPERFGKGMIEGVAGPEAANNAAASGELVPLLTLGIPGGAAAAVMLGALQGFGVRTGPLMIRETPEIIWTLIASLLIANVLLLIVNLPLIGIWVKVLKIPRALLFPGILVITTLGVYALSFSMFDVYLMVVFGLVGVAFRRSGIALAPVLLGVVLGPLLELNFRRVLTNSSGDYTAFVDSPLAVATLVLAGFVLFVPFLRGRLRAHRATSAGSRPAS